MEGKEKITVDVYPQHATDGFRNTMLYTYNEQGEEVILQRRKSKGKLYFTLPDNRQKEK